MYWFMSWSNKTLNLKPFKCGPESTLLCRKVTPKLLARLTSTQYFINAPRDVSPLLHYSGWKISMFNVKRITYARTSVGCVLTLNSQIILLPSHRNWAQFMKGKERCWEFKHKNSYWVWLPLGNILKNKCKPWKTCIININDWYQHNTVY